MGMGIMGGGMLMGWIYIILLIVGVAVLLWYLPKSGNTANDYKQKKPLDILEERYARGEIDREEFQNVKRDLV